MDLEKLSLGELIKKIVSTEFHKHEYCRGIAAPGKKVSEHERNELEKIHIELRLFYSEISRRKIQYTAFSNSLR